MMDRPSPAFATLADVVRWCQRAPAGTRLEASEMAHILTDLTSSTGGQGSSHAGQTTPEQAEGGAPTLRTWREKLWDVPAETRIGITELCEALDKPKSWVYSRTSSKADDRIPHRKMDGSLVFAVGEVRTFVRDHEEVVVAGPMSSTDREKKGLYAV